MELASGTEATSTRSARNHVYLPVLLSLIAVLCCTSMCLLKFAGMAVGLPCFACLRLFQKSEDLLGKKILEVYSLE